MVDLPNTPSLLRFQGTTANESLPPTPAGKGDEPSQNPDPSFESLACTGLGDSTSDLGQEALAAPPLWR